MRLINVKTLELEEFHDANQVKYAILSHRWEDREVLFKDVSGAIDYNRVRNMKGWYKIQQCCQQAALEGLEYAWVDTCCIDKSSSAELQETINSMYQWYTKADACYAFLSDVDANGQISRLSSVLKDQTMEIAMDSKWFERGWTLQELLAPREVIFYDARWTRLGGRSTDAETISKRTRIPTKILRGKFPEKVDRPCIAEIMSWASQRRTTRPEDRAYSLLGLFDVNMPLLYGEGESAFFRLQEEILRYSDDQSIFVWDNIIGSEYPGLLAASPDCFEHSAPPGTRFSHPQEYPRRKPHAVTNEGISLELELYSVAPRVYGAMLNAKLTYETEDSSASGSWPASIFLKRLDVDGRYARIMPQMASSLNSLRPPAAIYNEFEDNWEKKVITVVRSMRGKELVAYQTHDLCAFQIAQLGFEVDGIQTTHSLPYTIKESRHGPTAKVLSSKVLLYNSMDRIVVLIKIHHQAWQETPWHAPIIDAIALGFDCDFNPVCVLDFTKLGHVRQAIDWGRTTSFMLATEGWRHDSTSEHSLTMMRGCEWYPMGTDRLAIRMNLRHRDFNMGCNVTLQRRLPSGIDVAIFMSFNRQDSEQPWNFSCVVSSPKASIQERLYERSTYSIRALFGW